jgi:hypothetical protein
MYVAHIGPSWHQRFRHYADAVEYAARHGMGPAFVELNLSKTRYRARPVVEASGIQRFRVMGTSS